jgi:hypothetical protein
VSLIDERVADRDEPSTWVGGDGIDRRAGAPVAAADEADADRFVRARMRHSGDGHGGQRGRSGGRFFQEIASTGRGCFACHGMQSPFNRNQHLAKSGKHFEYTALQGLFTEGFA